MSERTPTRRTSDLTVRAAGSETLVYDPTSDVVHLLPAELTHVWNALDGGSMALVAARAGVSVGVARVAVARLDELGLVRTPAGFDRRRLLQRGALVGAGMVGASIVAPMAASALSGIGPFKLSAAFPAAPATGTSASAGAFTMASSSTQPPTATSDLAAVTSTKLTYSATSNSKLPNGYTDSAALSSVIVVPGASPLTVQINGQKSTTSPTSLVVAFSVPAGSTSTNLKIAATSNGAKTTTVFDILDSTGAITATGMGGGSGVTATTTANYTNAVVGNIYYVVAYQNAGPPTSDSFSFDIVCS